MANGKPNADADSAPSPVQRANSFLEKLRTAAENLVNLKIVTIVGDAELTGDLERPKVRFDTADSGNNRLVIATNINLVEGDMTTVIPTKYDDQLEGAIMKYHAEQVVQANSSVTQKLKLVESLIKDIVPLIRGDDRNVTNQE